MEERILNNAFKKPTPKRRGEVIEDAFQRTTASAVGIYKEQEEAVKHEKGPLLVIAGAGTGKTTVITERIKWLIFEKKINASEVLALTFTEKAAQEMEQRIDEALPYGYTQMWIATFHSFCDRVLRAEAIHIGLDPSFRLMTEAESILFLRRHLFALELDYFRPLGNPTKFIAGLLQHFSRLKDEDISEEQYLVYVKKIKNNDEEKRKSLELASAYKTYEALKAKEGVMDFSDLITNALKLFRTRKNVLGEYQKKFRHILVDEFQDTNFSQNELAILLTGEEKNITVVGDDDQAIYRWRGAALSNIIQFRKHFPMAKAVTLTQNFRSTQEILDKAYVLIQHNNPDRLEVQEKIDKKLKSVRGIKGTPPEFLHADRVENEAEKTAMKIHEILAKEKKLSFKDVAILVRANDHAEPFTRALGRAGIPYQFLGPGHLFRQEEIKNIISYLKVLYNFEDSVSLYRVLSMEVFGIEARDIAALLNFTRKRNMHLFETLEKIGGETFLADVVKEKIKKIVGMIQRHLSLVPKETAGQILYYFLENTGILKKMVDIKNIKEEKAAQNIAKFFDRLKTYEASHEDAGVAAVVDWIDLAMQMGESPLAANIDWTEIDAVNILTIHSSKGLEFPIVFLVNLVEQRFPTRERQEKIPVPDALVKEILPTGDYHLQEERRLFYVGATRARDYLFLTAANFYGEGKRARKISPFVYETLGDKKVESSKWKVESSKTGQLNLLEWKPEVVLSMNNEPKTKLLVDYLSYSQIETFSVCPMHYRAKYILKLPVPQSSAQSFGTSVHATLREFYEELRIGKKIGKVELIDLLNKNWLNEGYQSKKHELFSLERGKKMLTNFFENFYDEKTIPIALELPFKFRINNLTIGGRIDRIDNVFKKTTPKGVDELKSLKMNHPALRDAFQRTTAKAVGIYKTPEGIEITDYKTGVTIPTEKNIATNLQLTLYALAATEVHDPFLGKKPEEVKLSFYFLEDGVKLTTTRTREQLEEVKKLLLEKAEEIATSDFLCSKGMLCANCEYKMLCG